MFAAIMAGGSGTRFWPASTPERPKQFLRLFGDRTMLEHTVDRLDGLAADGDICIVTGARHADLTRALAGSRPLTVIAEPVGRNTAACIGLAALHFAARDADVPIAVLPADHFVGDVPAFRRALAAAGTLAREGAIVTLGIPPTAPETGFGYIEAGDGGETPDRIAWHSVRAFVEKPDRDTALGYLASGKHFWNAGIFVVTARVILGEIAACMPELSAGLDGIARDLGTEREATTVADVYAGLDSVSIDYGVMERTRARTVVIPAPVGWSDLGSWSALAELRAPERDAAGNVLPDRSVAIDAASCLVVSEMTRPVALLGVRDLIVVDAAEGLLVASPERAQDVRLITERLGGPGRG